MKISTKIIAPHGLLFVSDSFAKEDVPLDTSLANVTFTETCIAFWVMHELDGEVTIDLTDAPNIDALQIIFSGHLKCASGSISLSQPDMTQIATLKIDAKKASVNLYANDEANPDRVIVQIIPA